MREKERICKTCGAVYTGKSCWNCDTNFSAGHADPLVVLTRELADALDTLNYGEAKSVYRRAGIEQRQFLRVKNRQTKYTSLHVADAILSALERPELLHNGTVRVIPNPRWTKEKWEFYLNYHCPEDNLTDF